MKTTDAKIVYSPCPPSSKDVIWGKTVNGKIEFQTFGNKGWNTVAKEDILKDIFQIKEEILEELEDYIEEVTSQADWNQNDSGSDDFINNRTHWVDPNGEAILFEETTEVTQAMKDTGKYILPYRAELVVGRYYDIYFGGFTNGNPNDRESTFKECEVISSKKMVDWDEDFRVEQEQGSDYITFILGFSYLDLGSSLHIIFKEKATVYHKIDENYIPDSYAKTEDVTNRISTHNTDITAHGDIRLSVASQGVRISAVEELIPAQATSSNNLADKEFVNSSISTNTANFKGTYNTLAELEATTADNNDYGFVITTDAEGNTVYNRYKYDGTMWSYEYALNNSSFTAAQWASIQSGITSDAVTKLNGIVHDACKIRTDGFTKSSGTRAGLLYIWNNPRATGYYAGPDSIVQIFYPEVKTANDTISADSSGVIDISAPVTGEINRAVDSAIGSLRGEVHATFKKLYTQISTSTELFADTFNSIGVLTESITFTLPTITEGTAPEFNGQFTVDSNAAYSVTFPAGIVMRGDTTIEANGTYQFSICNGYGIIIKVN